MQQLHQSQINYIKMLSDKGPGFSVRGEATAALMNELSIDNDKVIGTRTIAGGTIPFQLKAHHGSMTIKDN